MVDDETGRLQRIEQRFRQRSNYAVHAVLYVCSLLLFVLFLRDEFAARQYMTLPNTGDLFLLLVVWTVIFVAHSVRFYFQEQMDRALRREMGEISPKAKRSLDISRLSDDGELLDWSDDEVESDSASLHSI